MQLGLGLGLNFPRSSRRLIPAPLSANHLAYYEASSGTLNASDAVASEFEKLKTWQDRSGNGRHAQQTTTANQVRVRREGLPVVYLSAKDDTGNQVFPQSTVTINNRASSFFALVETDRLMVNNIAENKVIMGLGTNTGDLYVSIAPDTTPRLAWRDGVNGTVVTSLVMKSSLTLVGVILGAAGIKIILDDQAHDIGSPLGAGNSTGFNLFKGSIASTFIGGFNVAVWLDVAADATGIAAIRSWAIARKAVYSVSKKLYGWGASIGNGFFAEGNLGFARQYAVGKTDLTYANYGFAGMTAVQMSTKTPVIFGINNVVPGTGLQDYTKRQVVWVYPPTNDLVGAATAASVITLFTLWREQLHAYGYRCVWYEIAKRGDTDAAGETKRQTINAAMAALDQRRYGPCIPVPAEIAATTPSDTTIYDADGVHFNRYGHSLIYQAAKAAVDAQLAIPLSTLHLDCSLDGNYQDSSGYTRDLVAVGSPTFVAGHSGRQALSCTSGGNYAHLPYVYRWSDVAYFAVMIWFKTSSTATMHLISKYQGVGTNWYLGKINTGRLFAGSNDIALFQSTAGTSYHDDVWHCAAFVTDTAGGKLYASPDHNPANLALVGSQAWGTPPGVAPNTGTANLRLGADNTASYNVTVQRPLIWLETRTLAQLQAVVA